MRSRCFQRLHNRGLNHGNAMANVMHNGSPASTKQNCPVIKYYCSSFSVLGTYVSGILCQNTQNILRWNNYQGFEGNVKCPNALSGNSNMLMHKTSGMVIVCSILVLAVGKKHKTRWESCRCLVINLFYLFFGVLDSKVWTDQQCRKQQGNNKQRRII